MLPLDENKLCKGNTNQGPCRKPIVRDHNGTYVGDFCHYHGGWKALKEQANKARFNYYLGQYTERVQDFATSPQVKNLREEIGVLRMILEVKINSLDANDEFEFLKATPVIADLVDRIDKLVNSCAKIETNLGLTLDKTQITVLADSIVEMLSVALQSTPLTDEQTADVLTKVTNGIANVISPKSPEATNP